jgi:hypothetical protein
MSLGIGDHVWSRGELIEAALAQVPPDLGRRHKKTGLTVIEGGKLRDFYGAHGVERRIMDAFLKLMTSDTTLYGVSVQNWMILVAGIFIIWTVVLVRDL